MRTLDPALRKHPLFNRADQNLSVEQAFEDGGLNFLVDKIPVYAMISDGTFSEIPSRQATYRYDEERVLGVVSNHYEVVQNKRGLEFLNAFFAECGCLRQSRSSIHLWLIIVGYPSAGQF